MNNEFEDAIEDLPPEDTGGAGVTGATGCTGATGAAPPTPCGARYKLTLDDFYAVAPDHKCLHRPTRKLWLNAAPNFPYSKKK